MKALSLLLISGILVISCSPASKTEETVETAEYVSTNVSGDFQKMKWLVGSWRGMYQGKPFYEAWRQSSDSVLTNYTIEISNGDTFVKENGTIQLRHGSVTYGTDSIHWKLIKLTADQIVLKNDTLPYSRNILWRNSADDHWLTFLTNPNNTVTEYDLIRQPELDQYVTKQLTQNL